MTALLVIYAVGVLVVGFLAAREAVFAPRPSARAALIAAGVVALWPLAVVVALVVGIAWVFGDDPPDMMEE
jgi:hypothetical protein